jgi:hypothetical protein
MIAATLVAFMTLIIPLRADAKPGVVNQLYTLHLMGTLIFSPLCSNRIAVLAIRAGTVTTSPLTHG